MRHRAKVDTNHTELVQIARAVGAVVIDLHALPGALDLLVGFRGKWTLFEVKDGARSASRKKATKHETATLVEALRCDAPAWIIEDAQELLIMIGAAQGFTSAVIERTRKAQGIV